MELEVAERDLLHLPIRRMIFDPVLVPAEPVAGVQDGGMPVGNAGKLIQSSAGQPPQPLVVRGQPLAHLGRQVDRQQVGKAAVGGIEIHAGAIGGDPVGTCPGTFDWLIQGHGVPPSV